MTNVPQVSADVQSSQLQRWSPIWLDQVVCGYAGRKLSPGVLFAELLLAQRGRELKDLHSHLGADRIFLAHGLAARVDGRVVVLAGPPGVGKSTALRSAAERSGVDPIDDAYALIVKRGGSDYVVATGTYPFTMLTSLYSGRVLRRLPLRRHYGDVEMPRIARRVLWRTFGLVHQVSRLCAAVALKPRGASHFDPDGLPLDEYAYVGALHDPLGVTELGFDGNTVMPHEQFVTVLDTAVSTRILSVSQVDSVFDESPQGRPT